MEYWLRQWEQSVVAMHLGVESRVRRILAVGCGAGREVFALEALGFEVTGVDISAALIDIARAEAERRSSAASFLQIDGVTLPFPDAGVDAVVMWAQVLGHVPGAAARAALLAEARRVLRTGGIVSLSVHDRARTRPLLDDRRILRADTPEPGDLVIREPDFGSIGYWRYFDEPELRTLVTGAGFANISVRVVGTFNGTGFTFTSAITAEVEIELDAPIEVTAGQPAAMTLQIDLASWFAGPGGALLSPLAPSQQVRSQIEQNIRRSFHAFEDEDRDGDPD